MSIKNISGDLGKYSDKTGCVEYDNISLKESGRIEIYIISDDIEQPLIQLMFFHQAYLLTIGTKQLVQSNIRLSWKEF